MMDITYCGIPYSDMTAFFSLDCHGSLTFDKAAIVPETPENKVASTMGPRPFSPFVCASQRGGNQSGFAY